MVVGVDTTVAGFGDTVPKLAIGPVGGIGGPPTDGPVRETLVKL